jgi:hypothetical protein
MTAASVSVPRASHGSGSVACRQRMIPDLPELDPPLSTITWVATASTYGGPAAGPAVTRPRPAPGRPRPGPAGKNRHIPHSPAIAPRAVARAARPHADADPGRNRDGPQQLAARHGADVVAKDGIMLSFGVSLASQGLIIFWRGQQSGIPFAPDDRSPSRRI